MRCALIASLALFHCLGDLRAQDHGPFFELVLAAELPSRTINCLAKDEIGTLWVGTPNGLARVIGDQVRVWQQQEADTTSLSSNMVLSVDASDPELVWVGTSRGLCSVDPVSGKVRRFPCQLPGRSGAMANQIRQVIRTDERNLWAATASDLQHFDIKHHRWSIAGPRQRGHQDISLPVVPGAMAFDAHRRILWLGTKFGLYKLDSTALNAPTEPLLLDVFGLSTSVMCLALDENGTLWIHDAERLALTIIDPDAGTISQQQLPPSTDPSSVCGAMTIEPSGAVWLATSDARLYHRPPGELDWRTIDHDPDGPWIMTNTLVHAMLCDATGTLWIGTEDGLVRSVPEPRGQRAILAWREPIGVNHIRYDAQRLYMATHGAGVVVIDPSQPDLRDTIRHIERGRIYDPSLPARLSDLVTDAVPMPDGGMVGTGLGVMRWNTNGTTYAHDILEVPKKSDLHRKRITAIERDRTEGVWVLSTHHGLWQLGMANEGPRHIAFGGSGKERELGPISSLTADPRSGVWCGTVAGELVHVDSEGNSGRVIALRDSTSLAGIEAICIVADRSLWVGFDDGSYHVISQDGPVPEVHHSGTVHDRILDMCTSDRTVWILSDGGLWQVDDTRTNRPIRRPLPPYWGRPLAIAADGNKGLFVAFSRAVLHMDGADDPYSSDRPIPVIAGIIRAGSNLPSHPYHARIEANYDQRSLRIQFSATGVARPELVRFTYRLDPTAIWSELGSTRTLDLPDLMEGRYVIEIAALDHGGEPMTPGVVVDLTIRPPWFRSGWAIICGVVIFIAILLSGARLVFKRRLRSERERSERQHDLLEERMRIAHDLHDDLGSSLALIAMEGELAGMSEDADARDALKRVSDSARDVTDNMRRIVWALGSGQDTLGDLAAYIRSSAAELMDRAGIELETTMTIADPGLALSVDHRRHLLLIVKEVLLNIVKHAGAGHAQLSIVQSDNGLAVTIADNGHGFDIDHANQMGIGALSIRERTKALGGTLVVYSGPDRGTTVELTIPIKTLAV